MVRKTPGIEIWIVRDSPEWFSGPNILKFPKCFCSNLLNYFCKGFLFSGFATFLVKIVRKCYRSTQHINYWKKNPLNSTGWTIYVPIRLVTRLVFKGFITIFLQSICNSFLTIFNKFSFRFWLTHPCRGMPA